MKLGEVGIVKEINLEEPKYFKVIHLGLSKNSQIKCVFKSPLKDPIAYQVKGCTFALRERDAKNIMVEV